MTSKLHWPAIGIFLILAVHALIAWADFLTPITAAVLGYLVISPVRRKAGRLGIPSYVVAMAFTLGLALLVAYGLITFAQPVTALLEDLPDLIRDFSQRLAQQGGAIEKLNEAAEAAQGALEPEKPKDAIEVEVVAKENYFVRLIGTAPGVVAQLVFALVLMFFLISSGDFFLARAVESLGSFKDKRNVLNVIRTIERKLGSYLGGITMINAGLGIAIGIAMTFWGLSSAMLFGFIAFALNFIPYLGAIAGAGCVTLAAYSQTSDLWVSTGVFLTYMTLTSLEGQLITPKIISTRLQLNTTAVFLAVAFFAWIWSVIGMVVAVPIMIVTKIALDEFEPTQRIGSFLGDAKPRDRSTA